MRWSSDGEGSHWPSGAPSNHFHGQVKGPGLNLMLPFGFHLSLLKKHHWLYLQPWDQGKDVELLFIKGLLAARLCARYVTYAIPHKLPTKLQSRYAHLIL